MYTQKIQSLKELLAILKNQITLLYDWLKGIVFKIFDSIVMDSPLDNRFYFLILSWIVCLLFYLGFFLVGKNPYSLFVPFSLYETPTLEQRTEATLYLSDGEGKYVTTKRKVLLYNDAFNKNVMTLLSELGELPYLSNSGNKDTESIYSVSLKKLPNIANTVVSLWYQEDKSNLIIDLSQLSIEAELTTIKIYDPYENPDQDNEELPKEPEKIVTKKEDTNQKKLAILSSAFVAAEKTIFDNFPSLKTIEYRINGKTGDYPGLEYKLSEKKVKR